jgi:hypothetical protein
MEMKMIKRCVKFIILLSIIPAVFPALLFSQDSEEVTPEEQFLQNIEIGIIREQAASLDRDAKLLALDNLEEMINDNKIDENSTEALYLLDYLAMEGVSRQVRMSGRLINYFPMVRKKAAELLGRIGGEFAVTTLLDILNEDNEPMVKAEAAYALGEIGYNEDEEVARVLAYEVMNQNMLEPDDNFAFAVMLAYEKIAEENGGIWEPTVYLSLIQIAQGNYIKMVRDKAFEVMDTLRGYSD